MRCIFTTSNYCVRFYSTTLKVGRGYGVNPKSGVTYPTVRTLNNYYWKTQLHSVCLEYARKEGKSQLGFIASILEN
jgi:hypothetical protein